MKKMANTLSDCSKIMECRFSVCILLSSLFFSSFCYSLKLGWICTSTSISKLLAAPRNSQSSFWHENDIRKPMWINRRDEV